MISSWEYTTEHIAAKIFFPVTSNYVSSNVSDSRFLSCTEFCEKLLGMS